MNSYLDRTNALKIEQAVDEVFDAYDDERDALIVLNSDCVQRQRVFNKTFDFEYDLSVYKSRKEVKTLLKSVLYDEDSTGGAVKAMTAWLKWCSNPSRLNSITKKFRGEDSEAVFGRYAFAPERSSKDFPKEPNTKVEDKVQRDLVSHFLNFGKEGSIGRSSVDLIKSIINDGLYNDLFRVPEPGTVIYRGMRVSKSWLKAALATGGVAEAFAAEGSSPCRFVLKPMHGHAQSWSLNRALAQSFSKKKSDTLIQHIPKNEEVYACVLSATVDDSSFLDCTRFYREFGDGLSRLKNEKEIIALKPVIVDKIKWNKV